MCAGERTGDIVARSRTQSSIAVSTDKVNWLLVNASPDIRTQLNANHALLQPARQLRDTGIVAVMLADSQIDHTTGLLILRESKQPLEMPSAGSTFQRPEGYFAGTLIEQTGLKGFSVGGAQISAKHAGFVVNSGEATATDVLNLIHEVQRRVYEKNGVKLFPEVRILGEE